MGLIFGNTINIAMCQRIRIVGDVAEGFKGIAVIPVQSIIGAKPKKTIVILENTPHFIVRKAVFNAQSFYQRSHRCAGLCGR
jgi:hypothetical protein